MSEQFLNGWNKSNIDKLLDMTSQEYSHIGTPDYFFDSPTSAFPSTAKKEIEVQIIPKLKKTAEISLSRGDTLVVFYPVDKYPHSKMKEILDIFDNMFPDNQTLFLPDDFELGVIRSE